MNEIIATSWTSKWPPSRHINSDKAPTSSYPALHIRQTLATCLGVFFSHYGAVLETTKKRRRNNHICQTLAARLGKTYLLLTSSPWSRGPIYYKTKALDWRKTLFAGFSCISWTTLWAKQTFVMLSPWPVVDTAPDLWAILFCHIYRVILFARF